jgi:nicotinamidase-related amidase
MQAFTKVGLEALLTPDNCVVVMIDHQPFQLANVNSHEPTMVINNAIGLAMTARAYGIPTILTTVNEDSGGQIFKGVQDIFPDHKTINRTYINAWEDERVVEAVKKTGRKKVVFAALWTEMCLAMPAIHAMGDGYDVYVVTDASGGVSTSPLVQAKARCRRPTALFAAGRLSCDIFLGGSTNRGISMTKVDFDREVVWPGRGLMTLRAAFKALHEIWSTSEPRRR